MSKAFQRKGAKLQRRKARGEGRWNLASIVFSCGLCLLLAACGRERATPTPLPASIVRPEQPAPVYGESTNFTLATVAASVTQTVPLSAALESAAPLTQAIDVATTTPQPISVTMNQTPAALGIVQGGAVLLEKPNGRALGTLPTGATVTVTGKSADGRYLAVYTEQGKAGWIITGQLKLFGGDDLNVVPASTGPGPIATLLAEAMQPVTLTLSTSLSDTSDLTLPIGVLKGSTVTP
ncbi:MAG: hypothetical protein U0350_12070 [Caldilineaceae bacterium]